MTKHTPGPWHAGEVKYEIVVYSVGSHRHNRIASMSIKENSPRKAEGLANALLISAAPDLLDLVEAALPMLQVDGQGAIGTAGRNMWDWCERARAALQKAKGE